MMNKRLHIHPILAFCWLCLPLLSISLHAPSAFAMSSTETELGITSANSLFSTVGNSGYSNAMIELMRASLSKYAEGSAFIKTGDIDKAQKSFDKAVDLLMNSNWDLASTPELNRFFQDLIQRIQQDESRYLFAPYEIAEDEETIDDIAADRLEDLDLIPITFDPEIREALIADLAKTRYEIPITINETVLKSLNFWLGRGRKVFEEGLVRSGQYLPMIERIFREESIPQDLLYLAQVESMFRPHAVSKAKAKGIWQFEKGTAVRYGLKVTRDVDERSDPEKSTRAAARYLKDLFAMFKDWNLALAAYNWGEGKVKRLINSTGLNDFWQLSDLKHKRRLPAETKNHVPLIQASVILGRNPEKFGLPTELDPPLQYTEVSVSKPIDLRAAAKVLSTSLEELKKLNPALRGLNTPANYPNFQLRVPLDSSPETEERLASLPAAKFKALPDPDCRHKVRSGETLTRIAARYQTTVSRLRQVNGFSTKSILRAGAWIRLPSCSEEPPKAASSKKSTKPKAKAKNEARAKTGGSKGASSAESKSDNSNDSADAGKKPSGKKPALEKIAAK